MLTACYCHRYLKGLVGLLRPIWVQNVLKNIVLELLRIYAHVGLCVYVCTSKVYSVPGLNQTVSWIKPNFQWELISFILITWYFLKSLWPGFPLDFPLEGGQGKAPFLLQALLPTPLLWASFFIVSFIFFLILTVLVLPCSTWGHHCGAPTFSSCIKSSPARQHARS